MKGVSVAAWRDLVNTPCQSSPKMHHQPLPTRNTLRQAQGNAFTGQYSYGSDDATDLGSSGFGLMFYQSRWYDPSLGRMAQADTIVPGGVQGLDRYAYVNNSPLNYVDPSGHFGQCHDGQSGYQCRTTLAKQAPQVSGKSACTDVAQFRFCQFANGARVDSSHFMDGVITWVRVLHAWANHDPSYTVSAQWFYKKPTELVFDLTGIESVDELREKFIPWYALVFQRAFEASNVGGSYYNTEDIPSAVMGATMASYNSPATLAGINRLYVQLGNMEKKETEADKLASAFGKYWTGLYSLAISYWGGGTGVSEEGAIYDGPRNYGWFFMDYDGHVFLYPIELDFLNTFSYDYGYSQN
jgi:RHS repeat-associated protein